MSAAPALLIVRLLAAGAAASSPGGLAPAEALIARVEQAAAEARAPGFCPLEAAVESLKDDPEFERVVTSGAALGDLLMLHVCRAVAAASPKPCGALAGVALAPTFAQMPSKSSTHTLDRRCLANYYNVLMSRASLGREPALKGLCLENETLHPVFLEGKGAEGCRIVSESFSAPEVCARLKPMLNAGATGCFDSMRQLVGDEAYCPSIKDRMNRELCLGAAAYRRALGRGPDACGADPVCRMMKAPAAGVCRVYEDRLRPLLCPTLASGARRRLSRVLASRLDEAERLLQAFADAGGRPAASRIDALEERVARARLALR